MIVKKKKTGGRKAGTPNKLTHEFRRLLSDALAGELEALPEILASLKPHQRVDVILRLCKYVLPPIEAVRDKDIDMAALDPEQYKDELSSMNKFNRAMIL